MQRYFYRFLQFWLVLSLVAVCLDLAHRKYVNAACLCLATIGMGFFTYLMKDEE